MQHLTRESTSSNWPLGRLRTVHLLVCSLRRTAYDSVAESGHPLRPGRGGGNWRAMTTRMGAQSKTEKYLHKTRSASVNEWRFSRFLPVLFRMTSAACAKADSGRWDLFRVVPRAQSRLLPICRLLDNLGTATAAAQHRTAVLKARPAGQDLVSG